MSASVDLRSTLSTSGRPGAAAASAEPQYLRYDDMPPTTTGADGTRTWVVRGQNCVVSYSRAKAGAVFRRPAGQDEYVVLLPDAGMRVAFTTASGREVVAGEAMVVVPPGQSSIELEGDGQIVLLLTASAEDLVAQSANGDAYAQWHANVAPYAPWPDPPAGHRLRTYRIGDHPYSDDRFARIFRTSGFMVNWFDAVDGPRDPNLLSPHVHDDFEQLSLVLDGDYVHHIRTPWTARLDDWREDQHELCGAPSLCIIPPPTVHTSQAVGPGRHLLIDIFCPPRVDFSGKPGWVLNADEYPAAP